jgi:hypothetical protein
VSGIKADWQLASLVETADDPFETMIYSSGLRVDLTGSEEGIHAALRRSLDLEGHLFNLGVTCPLKDGGQDCLTCTSFTPRDEEARSRLCVLGRDQRVIEKEAQARKAPLRELAGRVDEWTELGHLSDEYAELLTAVGL